MNYNDNIYAFNIFYFENLSISKFIQNVVQYLLDLAHLIHQS